MPRQFLRHLPIIGGLSLAVWASGVGAQDEPPMPTKPANDPLVVKPTTFAGNFDAALLMVKLARFDLAKYYLDQALALSPSTEDLMALRAQHGTSTFLELTRFKELEPSASILLNQVTEAVRAQVEQPGYADSLIEKLNRSGRERAEAISELQHLGPVAVPPLLSKVEDGQIDRGSLTKVLVQLGGSARDPLIGALLSPSNEIRAIAAEVLGFVGSDRDAIWLWAPAFAEGQSEGVRAAARLSLARLKYGDVKYAGRLTSDEASRQLMQTANQFLKGTYVWPQIYDDLPEIPVWVWSAEKNNVVEQRVPRDRASLYFAERLARDATVLSPDSEQPPVVLLTTLLIRAVEANSWNLPLPVGENAALDLAVRSGPEIAEKVLRYSLDNQLAASAVGALQALSLNGSPTNLQQNNGRTPVIEALDAADQRVQFAAATAILHWEPTQPFRSSHRVIEILARAVNSQRQTASVVMDPNVPRASQTGSLFQELGYTPTLVRSGQEGFTLAAERGDIALAVLHPNVIRWELSQTLENLRADSRTANIPVVIYGPRSIRDRFEGITSQFQNVVFLDEGNTASDLSRELQPFLVQLNPPPISAAQRVLQMKEAAQWLRRIAIRNVPHVFDLQLAEEALTQSLHDPDIGEDALIALGGIGRPSVQTEFLNLVTAESASNKLRQLAGYQLAYHIQHHGLLLPQSAVGTLTRTYINEKDPQVRLAMESVIGSLKPSPAAVRKQVLSFPASPGPEFQTTTP